MTASKFIKIQVLSTAIALILPIAIYLIMWNSLPEQIQVNVMTNPLYLSRTIVAFVIPAALSVVHLIITFVIRHRAIKEGKPQIMWLCFLLPLLSIIGMIPILTMNI